MLMRKTRNRSEGLRDKSQAQKPQTSLNFLSSIEYADADLYLKRLKPKTPQHVLDRGLRPHLTIGLTGLVSPTFLFPPWTKRVSYLRPTLLHWMRMQ